MTFRPRDASVNDLHAVETILSRIGDKWAVFVVVSLGEGPLRFNDLQRTIPILSGKMLITTLRRLQAAGIVAQGVARTGATRTYALTAAGHELRPLVQALADWAARDAARTPAVAAAE